MKLIDDRDEYPDSLWNLGHEEWLKRLEQNTSEDRRLLFAQMALERELERVEKGVPTMREQVEADERKIAARAARTAHHDRQMAAFEPVLKEQIRKYAERNAS